MDQLVVILVVGAVALGKWLLENAGKLKGDDADSSQDIPTDSERRVTPVPRRPNLESASSQESEEEKMRRFMEALGLPQGSVPPPSRKPVSQSTPLARQASKPLPAPRPHPRQMGRPIQPSSLPRRPQISRPLDTGGPLPTLPKTASVSETAPSMEVTSIPQMTFAQPQQAVQSAGAEVGAPLMRSASSAPVMRQQTAQATLREALRDPASLRKAILLREILGAPKGLQSVQTPSIFSPL